MTTPDPFSPSEASHYNANDFSAPSFNQPPANQPLYPAPGYGTHHYPPQPGSSPVDGVSVAAFVTGLLVTGPVAVILGAIGLARTGKGVRSGRWMAWTGMVLGVLGIIAWIALIALWGWMRDSIEANGVLHDDSVTTERQLINPDVDSYGDDAFLDMLWDGCAAGDMVACDDLFVESPLWSEYEDFGYECGTQGRKPFQFECASK